MRKLLFTIRYPLFATLCYSLFILITGCATTGSRIKATSPNTEVVEAEGMSPIVNNDIINAKKSALHEALKTALGLVVGVYVSQEALVSKAMLIDDNITSQTEGYVEKYEILKEWQEGNFYKIRIKALVRKEDIAAKIKALELEPQKLGTPLIAFSIKETIDGKPSNSKFAESELKTKFVDAGFRITEPQFSDIIVNGVADANFYTSEGLGGMFSYVASLSLQVLKSGSDETITTDEKTAGGAGITKQAAAKTSIINAARKVGEVLPDIVLKHLKERSSTILKISNIKSIVELHELVKSLRALPEIRDCLVRSYSENNASIELNVKKGKTTDIANRIEQLLPLKILKTAAYSITAEFQSK